MSRFINSSGFPFLFPPAPAPPAPRPANHVRQPTSNTPLATMATIAKGTGGGAPLPMDRSTRPAGTPAITPFAAANAALLVLVLCDRSYRERDGVSEVSDAEETSRLGASERGHD